MTDAPTFPPLLTGHEVEAGQAVFDTAVAAISRGDAGAGDLFWSNEQDVLQVSIVLEPECDKNRALQMLFVTMVAFTDSFGAIGPPEIGIFYQWPNQFKITGAAIGRTRVAVAACEGDAVPDWLVVGIEVQMMPRQGKIEPGNDLLNTSLWDEGAGELDRVQMIESFARHLLTWIHNWGEEGFKPVYEAWIGRAQGHKEHCEIRWQGKVHKGTFLSIDEEGQLLLKGAKKTVALAIDPVVEQAGAA